jgi:hypothetical protein
MIITLARAHLQRQAIAVTADRNGPLLFDEFEVVMDEILRRVRKSSALTKFIRPIDPGPMGALTPVSEPRYVLVGCWGRGLACCPGLLERP